MKFKFKKIGCQGCAFWNINKNNYTIPHKTSPNNKRSVILCIEKAILTEFNQI